MAAYSINLCDGGAIMNNSAITQRANGTSPWWPANSERRCSSTLTEEVGVFAWQTRTLLQLMWFNPKIITRFSHPRLLFAHFKHL